VKELLLLLLLTEKDPIKRAELAKTYLKIALWVFGPFAVLAIVSVIIS